MTSVLDDSRNLPPPVIENPEGPYRLASFNSRENLGFLLKGAWMSLAAAVDQELVPYGLTYPQFVILVRLHEGDCSTAAELARVVGTDTGAMTRMLDRLQAKGALRRVRSREDRRVVNLEITEAGRRMVETAMVISVNVLNRCFGDFSGDEMALLQTLLERITTRAGRTPSERAASAAP